MCVSHARYIALLEQYPEAFQEIENYSEDILAQRAIDEVRNMNQNARMEWWTIYDIEQMVAKTIDADIYQKHGVSLMVGYILEHSTKNRETALRTLLHRLAQFQEENYKEMTEGKMTVADILVFLEKYLAALLEEHTVEFPDEPESSDTPAGEEEVVAEVAGV